MDTEDSGPGPADRGGMDGQVPALPSTKASADALPAPTADASVKKQESRDVSPPENKGSNAVATSSKVKLEDFDSKSGELKSVLAGKRLSRREIEAEEERYAARATAALKANRELDHATTTRLQSSEAFTSYADVVDKLLPWHIWQIHDEDQDSWSKSKKRKMRETEDTIKLAERKVNLEQRFRKLRLRAFDTNAMLPAEVQAAQVQTEDARVALTQTMSNLRDARVVQDRLQEEQRVKADAERRKADDRRRREEEAKRQAAARAKPPAPPSQTIVITIPMSCISQLTAAHVVSLPNHPAPPDGKPPPAKVVRTSDDLTQVVISVNVGLCNPAQLNLLASLIQKQKAVATTGTIQPAAAPAPAAPT